MRGSLTSLGCKGALLRQELNLIGAQVSYAATKLRVSTDTLGQKILLRARRSFLVIPKCPENGEE